MSGAAARPWWSGGVRLHHPNMRSLDLLKMDFDDFVAEAVSLRANAVVISAGGYLAYYPSEIDGHHVSALLNGRDFVGEVTGRAQAAGLRVIARVDFSVIRERELRAHPDWAARDAAGATIPGRGQPDLYATCPNSPYRGAGFALPVLREILGRYAVDGFHVNSGGWPTHCHCEHCQVGFRDAMVAALPRAPEADPLLWAQYVEWRYARVADSLARMREAVRELDPDAMLTGEFGLRGGSYSLPLMAPTVSALQFHTGDVAGAERRVRSEAGLAARYARTVKRDAQPIINLKVYVRNQDGWPRAMVPPAEYRLWLWQALANGAGLKVPFTGTLDQDDRRNVPAVGEVFGLMERHPEVYREARPVASVALVWPGRTFDHWRGPAPGGVAPGGDLLAAFNGMYSLLVDEHVPFDVLADSQLTSARLAEGGYRALVLAGAACLDDVAVVAVTEFVRAGGGLLLTGWTGWADAAGQLRAAPALAEMGGVRPLDVPAPLGPGLYLACGDKGMMVSDGALTGILAASGLDGVGLVLAAGPAPPLAATASAVESLPLVRHRHILPLERTDEPEPTGCAGIVLGAAGAGRVATVAPPLDALYWRWGLVDHRRLLGELLRWCAGVDGTASGWPVETEAPGTVEVTLARGDRRRIVHFVNATGPAPLQEVIPVDVGVTRVRLDPGERCRLARRVVTGEAVALTQEGRDAQFRMGALGAYEAVVLEVEAPDAPPEGRAPMGRGRE
jgi:hypothetical protein